MHKLDSNTQHGQCPPSVLKELKDDIGSVGQNVEQVCTYGYSVDKGIATVLPHQNMACKSTERRIHVTQAQAHKVIPGTQE
jgi:hypothetical protein